MFLNMCLQEYCMFGNYDKKDHYHQQPRLSQAWPFVLSYQSLSCLHTADMNEDSDNYSSLDPYIAAHGLNPFHSEPQV